MELDWPRWYRQCGLLVCFIFLWACQGSDAYVNSSLSLDFPLVRKLTVRMAIGREVKDLKITFDDGFIVINQAIVSGLQKQRVNTLDEGLDVLVNYYPVDVDATKFDGTIGFARESQFFLRYRYMEISRQGLRLQNSGFRDCFDPYNLGTSVNYTFNPKHEFTLIPYHLYWLFQQQFGRVSGPVFPYKGEEVVLGLSASNDYTVVLDMLENKTCFVYAPELITQGVHFFHNCALIACIAMFLLYTRMKEFIAATTTERRLETRSPEAVTFHHAAMLNAFVISAWLLLWYAGVGLPSFLQVTVFIGILITAAFHRNMLHLLIVSLAFVLERSCHAIGASASRFITTIILLNYLGALIRRPGASNKDIGEKVLSIVYMGIYGTLLFMEIYAYFDNVLLSVIVLDVIAFTFVIAVQVILHQNYFTDCLNDVI